MVDLNITDTERLILANQYEILGKLDNDVGYMQISEQLRNGHEYLYSETLENLLSDNLGGDKTQFVLKVLDLYTYLKNSYEALDDQSGIDPHEIRFDGFDANHERDILTFTQQLYDNRQYVTIMPTGAIDSHMPVIEIYKRMVDKWEDLGKPTGILDRDTIIAILDAKTHPSHR